MRARGEGRGGRWGSRQRQEERESREVAHASCIMHHDGGPSTRFQAQHAQTHTLDTHTLRLVDNFRINSFDLSARQLQPDCNLHLASLLIINTTTHHQREIDPD